MINEEFEDIMDQYDGDVMTGIVHARGKFEGEHWSTVALWELAMNGFCTDTLFDDDDTELSLFALDDEDRAQYNIPDDILGVVLWETNDGFVCSSWMNEAELALFAKELLANEELDYEQ